jgi:hypothetical protein
MQILIDLLKVGALGGSLAFLYLSFQLLQAERGLKDAANNPISPRPEILREIRRFRASALVFLLVGVTSELVLSNSANIVLYLLRSDLVRVRFDSWELAPENQTIAFSFLENKMDARQYILPREQGVYNVFVGVRKKDSTPYDYGQYKIVLGPYHVGSLSHTEKTLTTEEQQSLGGGCVEFTAFGIEQQNSKPAEISLPFVPNQAHGRVVPFHTAYACQ